MIFQESHLKILLHSISPVLSQFSRTLSQKTIRLTGTPLRHISNMAAGILLVPITQFSQNLKYAPLIWETRYDTR